MGNERGENGWFDILDVERFRAVPAAMVMAFGSVWGIGLALGAPEDRNPVLFWLPVAVVVLGWAIWLSYFVAQRRQIDGQAIKALEDDERRRE
ncbi:hypothetical protein [Serinicoccus sediminis]|uniref:hypothetical protein n=1 Tax=Serinicoccus sediminis TaxID=2306021 RepID=UPI0010211570|nr:hypothetical protein [Serinicoccus sediminis]